MLRKSILRYDNGMGFSFPDLGTIISDPKQALKSVTSQVEQSVSTKAQEILPETLYEKASTLVQKQGTRLAEDIEGKATSYIMSKAGEYAGKKENQDTAITSGVNAMANKVSAEMIKLKDAWRAGTFTSQYKMPLMIGGGIFGLLFFRKAITGLVTKPRTVSNPKRRKTRKKRK